MYSTLLTITFSVLPKQEKPAGLQEQPAEQQEQSAVGMDVDVLNTQSDEVLITLSKSLEDVSISSSSEAGLTGTLADDGVFKNLKSINAELNRFPLTDLANYRPETMGDLRMYCVLLDETTSNLQQAHAYLKRLLEVTTTCVEKESLKSLPSKLKVLSYPTSIPTKKRKIEFKSSSSGSSESDDDADKRSETSKAEAVLLLKKQTLLKRHNSTKPIDYINDVVVNSSATTSSRSTKLTTPKAKPSKFESNNKPSTTRSWSSASGKKDTRRPGPAENRSRTSAKPSSSYDVRPSRKEEENCQRVRLANLNAIKAEINSLPACSKLKPMLNLGSIRVEHAVNTGFKQSVNKTFIDTCQFSLARIPGRFACKLHKEVVSELQEILTPIATLES